MERIEFEILTKELLELHLDDIILIDNQAFGSDAWGENNFRYQLPLKYDLSFLVKIDNKLIAYCINSKKEEDCYIHRIVIKNDYKGLGLGSKMINYILNQLNQKKISLKVNVNNIFAINFYFKMNFKIDSIQKEYYTMKRI